MKKCRDVEELLPLYVDDSLSGEDKKAVEEHLQSCPGCAKAIAQLQKTKTFIDGLHEVEPPPWFKQKIMAQVRREEEKKNFVRKLFYPWQIKIPVQVFATVFMAVLAFYIYRTGEERMNEVVSLPAPAPVMETQKGQMPEQIMKTIDKKVQKEHSTAAKEVTRGPVGQAAVDMVKDANEYVVSGMKTDRYQGAPAATSLEEAKVKLAKKKESYAPAAALQTSREQQDQNIQARSNVVLRVTDVDAATKEVEKLLEKYEARNISRQMMQDKITLEAVVNNQKFENLKEHLKTVGKLEESGMPPDDAVKNIILIINILKIK